MLFSVLMFEYNISRYSLINKMDSGTGSECVKRTQAKLGDLRPSGLFWVLKRIVSCYFLSQGGGSFFYASVS